MKNIGAELRRLRKAWGLTLVNRGRPSTCHSRFCPIWSGGVCRAIAGDAAQTGATVRREHGGNCRRRGGTTMKTALAAIVAICLLCVACSLGSPRAAA